jgi:hypothetical protein
MSITNSTMIEVLGKLLDDQERRFMYQLSASGNPQLQAAYQDLTAVRRTHDLLLHGKTGSVVAVEAKKSPSRPAPDASTTKKSGFGRGVSTLPELGFSLRDSVRELLPNLGSKWFTTRQMYEILQKKHGADVIDEKRLASVSATLSNMFGNGELDKIVDAQRKVKFKAADDGGFKFGDV